MPADWTADRLDRLARALLPLVASPETFTGEAQQGGAGGSPPHPLRQNLQVLAQSLLKRKHWAATAPKVRAGIRPAD